jgi:hypothetical protein
MRVMRVLLIGMLIVVLPGLAGADIIPISDVNEIVPPQNPNNPWPSALDGEIVTVQGVALVASGTLGGATDIYIQDATGGVNVRQVGMASPVVAVGDSVRVTGFVDHATSSGRTALFVTTQYPDTRMVIVNSGNELPEPLELTPREISVSGEYLEGIYAVIRGVSLTTDWVDCDGEPDDDYARVTDGDTVCYLWFDKDTDFCQYEPPLETFDVYGFVIPDIDSSPRDGHGVLPVMRSDVHSSGPGSGYVSVSPTRTYTRETVDLSFDFEADGGLLTQVSINVPAGWQFSGQVMDVVLDGPAFSEVLTVSTPDYVALTGCELTRGSSGTVTLEDVVAPESAGAFTFVVKTADDGGDLANIQTLPEIGVGATAVEGSVLINEIYAHSGGNDLLDRAEFIELYNPGNTAIDLTGWVLTDVDNSGECSGSNLWEFPEGAVIDSHAYIVVAKDASQGYYTGVGFYEVFYEWPDYEMFDPYFTPDLDWPDGTVPNMVLVSPYDGDVGTSQEIRLIGGADGNGKIVAGAPVYEAVFLYTDRTMEYLVDSVEYRNPVYLSEDPCAGAPGLGGLNDAWSPGPPPWDTSLARSENSDDTDSSIDDFALRVPTPGERNPASDEFGPMVSSASGASHNLALVVFNEPVDIDAAEDRGNYVITDTLGADVVVFDAELSRDGRTVLLRTADRVPGVPYSIDIDGVTDTTLNPMDSFTGTIQFGETTVPIHVIQEYDETGFCLIAGDTVKTVGLTTVPPGVFQPQYTSMYVQEPDGAGVNVFAFGPMGRPALEGDLVASTGVVVDYVSSSSGAGATTEIEASSISVLARGFEPLPPTVLPTGEVGTEENEGLFVRTSGVIVSVEGFAIYIDDGTGSIQVYQNFNDLDFGQFAVGDNVEMTGVILQYDQLAPFFSGYELSPRYDSDMVFLEAAYSEEADIDVAARVLDVGAGDAIEISYNAPKASHVTVRIFDLKGREVATVYDGICLGPQRATWDARDNDGRRVPMGAYLCHVLARDRGQDEGGTNAAIPIVVGRKLD